MQEFQKKLLIWFKKNKRDLPWRKTKSPYKIWVSEIMLQQTQVNTVIPYYLRFLDQFPTIKKLAKADLQQVLKVWEGLGYYSRVRNMYKAAKMLVENNRGQFPKTFSEIEKLPGIGRYTAGAISSIAFQIPVPVVDGNVKRVLARYFEIETEINSTEAKKQFWPIVSDLVPQKLPGNFNQALMEIGATVCLPKNPLCESCPICLDCKAKLKNRQQDLPVKNKNAPIPHYQIGAGLIWRKNKLLITRRPENGLLGGLWEFPGGKQEKNETIQECVRREIEEELGVQVQVEEHFMTVKHAYSHFRITLDVYSCQWISSEPECKACSDFRWVTIDQLDAFPFPKANKRIVEKLTEKD